MFTHYVRLFSRSALVVGEPQTFPFRDSQIMVWDAWKDKVHHGLNFTVRLAASDLLSAMKKSLPTVMPLTNMLAVTQSAAIGSARVLFAIDLDGATPDRQFGQVIYDLPSGWLRRRRFEREALVPLWNKFGSGTDPDVDEALNMAMFGLRKSYESPTLLDEFVELYFGLESLNSALQRKYNLATKEVRACQKCGEPVGSPVSSGIRHAVTVIAGESGETWKKIRGMRVAIIHRRRTLPNVTTGLYDNVLVLRRALPRAIFDLMGTAVSAEGDKITLQEPAAIVVSTALKYISPEQILDGRPLPHFKVEGVEEIVQGAPGPIFQEPLAAQVWLTLEGFDGAYTNLETAVWTGRYYDLPKGGEERKTSFAARIWPKPVRPVTSE